ncbi:MIR motif-containing protein [Sporodiniella umbellata]|nr:MIR motif-containing protein [Sporodiniella umbellata]
MKFVSLLSVLSLPLLFVLAEKPQEGFEKVSCASIIKLGNNVNGFKLHSHSVTYGSGSGQQSVTGFPESNDANSFWIIKGAFGHVCNRGEPVPCGSIIRLKHANTKGYLHSHLHSSPLSKQQEVSCFDGEDEGDDWEVKCSGTHWLREEPVQLVHKQTSAYLTGSESHTFGQPIPGQIEIAAYKSSSKHSRWVAQEGVYFSS